MKYRAFWKSTWYECEDYGALCRCLFWVGADSFSCVPAVVPYIDCFDLKTGSYVVVYKFED